MTDYGTELAALALNMNAKSSAAAPGAERGRHHDNGFYAERDGTRYRWAFTMGTHRGHPEVCAAISPASLRPAAAIIKTHEGGFHAPMTRPGGNK